MKKYKSLVLLVALAALAVSCSQNDSIGRLHGENDRVIISTGIDAGLQTRASGDLQLTGYSLRYILEVRDENDVVAYREEKLVTDAAQAVDFEFSLPDEGDYDALLWADYIADDATLSGTHYDDLYYTTNTSAGLKAVSIIGSAYAVNTASRDAFFGKASFTKGATQAHIGTVTLKRPFSRINIIEKDASVLAKLTSMDLVYDVPSGFNVMDGSVSGSYSVAIDDVISFPAAAAEKANLFFDYIFAPVSGQHLLGEIEIAYSLTSASGTFTIPANIPVERNKRTNISGSILTDPSITGLSVEIDDAWTDPDIERHPDTDGIIQIGSYYYEGGYFSSQYTASLTCLGVVFEVDATGEHGKIVSLDETFFKWGPDRELLVVAVSHDNGKENMDAIKTIDNTFSEFPAFKWCIDKGEGWYLPAKNELKSLYDVWSADKSSFNTKLTDASGTILDGGANNYNVRCYWSSTQWYTFSVYMVSFWSGSLVEEGNGIFENYVRAIRKF